MSIVRPNAIKNGWCGSAKAASSANYPRSPATPSELDVTEAIGSDHQEPFPSPRGGEIPRATRLTVSPQRTPVAEVLDMIALGAGRTHAGRVLPDGRGSDWVAEADQLALDATATGATVGDRS
jgi:hypothetical protein